MINTVNNKSSQLFTTMMQSKTINKQTPAQQTVVTQEKSVSKQLNRNEIIKYGAIGTGIILILLALLKRKKIAKFFKELFNKDFTEIYPSNPPKNQGKNIKPPSGGNGGNPSAFPVGVKNETELEKLHLLGAKYSDIKNQNPLMLKYEELKEIFNKYRRENLDEKRIATATKMTEIRKMAQEKNISLVPKKELPITATLDERLKYLEDDVYPVMDTSIASTFDGYEMFEKYGFNTSDLTLGYPNSTFSDFSLHAITADVTKLGDDFLPVVTATDEVVSRYLDLFNKFAKKEYGDEENLEFILDRTNKIMSEETALKYIATLKRYIPTQKYIVNPEFIFLDRTFGRFKDSEKIKAAIEDLKEYSKDLPKH